VPRVDRRKRQRCFGQIGSRDEVSSDWRTDDERVSDADSEVFANQAGHGDRQVGLDHAVRRRGASTLALAQRHTRRRVGRLDQQVLTNQVFPAQAVGHADESRIKLGYAKCAQCTPVALTPENATGVKIDAIGFNTGNDVLTALVSRSIDVAQVTYLHYAMALDRGFDVVAISGQISGGQQA
jgi:hypothetical protein